MTAPRLCALVGGGVLASAVLLRWLLDRKQSRLRKVLGDNIDLLDKEEMAIANMLMRTGHETLLRGWPRKGVKDAEKRSFLRTTARILSKAYADAGNARIPVLKSPVAVQKPFWVKKHGDSRFDPWNWLRSDDRDDPEVLAHIKAENSYCAAVMADTEPWQAKLYQEMRGRIQETDRSVPVPKGKYFYYVRTVQDKQYVIHCRRAIPEAQGAYDEATVMGEGVDSPGEEVLLDENAEAAKHKYYQVAAVSVTDDGQTVAFSEDTVGSEKYSLRVLDMASRKSLLNIPIGNTQGQVEWAADNKTFFYVTQDASQRPHKVFRHSLDSGSEPECIFTEDDEKYYVSIGKSADKAIIFVVSSSSMQNEICFVESKSPSSDLKVLLARQPDVDHEVEHWHGHLFMIKRTTATPNSELLIAPLSDPASQRVLRPHREDAKIEDMAVFDGHIAVLERVKGQHECHVFPLSSSAGGDAVKLDKGERLDFGEAAGSHVLKLPSQPDFTSNVLHVYFSSLSTPSTWLAHNMNSGKRTTKKVAAVLGGFDSANYTSKRMWATSHDGVKVPISLVYNHRLVSPQSPSPLLLDAYGAYEICNDPTFARDRLSILDRGVMYAIAHVRGGGEMGRRWYETGRFLTKRNTFLDTVAVAEHLVKEGWTEPGKLVLEGRSAGGMTVGAVANMRPDLFKAIVAGVPFVDCVSTMLDASLPLTTLEYEEWGNPEDKKYYDYMLTYSPLDNVVAQAYPHMFITAGLHDPRVAYWEPAKWVAKLRLYKTNDSTILFKCDMGAGHFSQSGRFDVLKEKATEMAFVFKVLDIIVE